VPLSLSSFQRDWMTRRAFQRGQLWYCQYWQMQRLQRVGARRFLLSSPMH
jgi:hypothetical protein